jgi:DNA polymerase I-like protein with 3'-5' exonuclease and polymerase domains
MYPIIEDYDYVAIDVETKGLKWYESNDGIFGIAIATPDGKQYYYDVREDERIIDHLAESTFKKVVNHNIKFDLHMLHAIGIMIPPEICECTMVRASLINEHLLNYSLDNIAKRYLGAKKESDIYNQLSHIFGGPATRKSQIGNLHKAPSNIVAPYAKQDTYLALKLWEYQESEIIKHDLTKIWNIEKQLFPVVFDMEKRGVRIDVQAAQAHSENIKQDLILLQEELNQEAGFKVNCNSTDDLAKLFKVREEDGEWLALDGTVLNKTPTGKAKIDKESLAAIDSPLAEMVLSIKQLSACKNTFLDNHILSHVTADHYVHPNINQTRGDSGGTVTGRFSITQPALQQIPSRDKNIASILRPLFLPDKDHIWYCFDYEQFEFRMFSHYVNDKNINETYEKDPAFDFHQMVADLTGLPRNAPKAGGGNAKTVNLGMLYDMGGGLLAKTMKLPYQKTTLLLPDNKRTLRDISKFIKSETKPLNYQTHLIDIILDDLRLFLVFYVVACNQRFMMSAEQEALEVMNKYYDAIPGVKKLSEKARNKAKEQGYITSIGGRKLRFNKDFHKAKARLCQGSSADCMKLKLIELYKLFKEYYPECRIYLSVHDEFNIGVPKEYDKEKRYMLVKDVEYVLCNFSKDSMIHLRVPIMTDYDKGANWGIASGKG